MATTALLGDVDNAPVQDITVERTIDYLNMPTEEKVKRGKEESTWQGYILRFGDTQSGTPKDVIVGAGYLLAIQLERGIEIFEETAEGGHQLNNFRMGIQDGEIIFEEA